MSTSSQILADDVYRYSLCFLGRGIKIEFNEIGNDSVKDSDPYLGYAILKFLNKRGDIGHLFMCMLS